MMDYAMYQRRVMCSASDMASGPTAVPGIKQDGIYNLLCCTIPQRN